MKGRKLISILLLTMMAWGVSAQNALLFPHLNDVQQVLQRNPAMPFESKVSIALGSAFVGYENNFFDYGAYDDALPVLPQVEAVVRAHTRTEKISLIARADLFSTSVLTNVGRFSVGFSQRADVKLAIPEEFTNYIFFGNDYLQNRTVLAEDGRVEASSFIEVALRYQTLELNDGLRFGGSLKVLGGQGHGVLSDGLGATTNVSGSDTLQIDTRARGRASGPAAFGADTTLGIEHLLRKPNNLGLAIDMGLHYQFDDTWSFGLSVLDLGFIRWKRRVYDVEASSRFRSLGVPNVADTGADIDGFFNSLDSLIIEDPTNSFEGPDAYGEAYTRPLFPSVLGTANAQVSDAFEVGASYGYDADGLRGQHSIGVNAKVNAGDYVQALAGYSYAGAKQNGLGIGLVLAVGPLQVYATADNVLDLVDQDKFNGVALNAGANLVFPMLWFNTAGGTRSGKKRGKAIKCFEF